MKKKLKKYCFMITSKKIKNKAKVEIVCVKASNGHDARSKVLKKHKVLKMIR